MEYTIRMENAFFKSKYLQEVEGEPFTIYGYEEFNFFKRMVDGQVVVSEVSTGLQIGDFYCGEMAAHDDIKRRIDAKGVEVLRKLIAENQLPSKAKATPEGKGE